MHFVTLTRLSRANSAVTRELDAHGLYDEAVQAVDTCLVPLGIAHGWQWYGGTGEIHIPCVSLSRLSHLWTGGYTSLRDFRRSQHSMQMQAGRWLREFDELLQANPKPNFTEYLGEYLSVGLWN